MRFVGRQNKRRLSVTVLAHDGCVLGENRLSRRECRELCPEVTQGTSSRVVFCTPDCVDPFFMQKRCSRMCTNTKTLLVCTDIFDKVELNTFVFDRSFRGRRRRRRDHEPLLEHLDPKEEPGGIAGDAVRHRTHHGGHEQGAGIYSTRFLRESVREAACLSYGVESIGF